MGDRGLHTSVWATERNGDAQHTRRPGDWTCPSCGFSNFQRRTECFRCSFTPTSVAFKDDTMEGNGYGLSHMMPQSQDIDPKSSMGDLENTPSGLRAHIPPGPIEKYTHHIPKVNNGRNGLYTSRWAPRNSSGGPKVSDSAEVWTKVRLRPRFRAVANTRCCQVVPRVNATSDSCTNNISPTTPSPPDLGLPYEVQHYILAMMQRILEEACYDFASRWMPNILNQNNWTCPEAVELSIWRKVLPPAIPPNVIVPVKNYSLEDALADAVRIRNSAVHRHLCDNVEIRRMASQAQDLMSMFSDVTRQTKFHHLWDELNGWDTAGQQNLQAARSKLQEALQEISERPMDDMDWTPNAVSLQEITSDAESLLEIEEQYVDEMELD